MMQGVLWGVDTFSQATYGHRDNYFTSRYIKQHMSARFRIVVVVFNIKLVKLKFC